MNVVFAGTPEFALPSLEAIAASGHRLAAVLTRPDRPAGRGRRPRAAPVKRRARELGATLWQPESLKNAAAVAQLAALAPELIVVVAYGLLLPPRVLALPAHGCINVHASLLPRWRGAAPIARAIAAGDDETGVSLMRMTAGLDSGPVIARRARAIAADTTAGELHDALAADGAALLAATLARDPATWRAQDQDAARATYARRLTKAEAAIDWRRPAAAIARAVRAFAPWPVAYATLDGEPVRLWRAEVAPTSAGAPPGTVIAAGSAGIDIATGAGALRVHELQLPGKRRTVAREAVHGRDWLGLRFA